MVQGYKVVESHDQAYPKWIQYIQGNKKRREINKVITFILNKNIYFLTKSPLFSMYLIQWILINISMII